MSSAFEALPPPPGGRLLWVRGTVQGVGFRPWVWRLAQELGLNGQVSNDPDGVHIQAWGSEMALNALCSRLQLESPTSARVEALSWDPLPGHGAPGFHIEESGSAGEPTLTIPPDLAPCPDCLRELFDPTDRRYRYPFLNCTACGPRYTVLTGLPWDRQRTTLVGFPLCPDCLAEYEDPADRRFHAQPIACPACGPLLRLVDAHGIPMSGDPIQLAATSIAGGAIVAIQGVGGFQLACDATDPEVVARLRRGKQREEKPFAVMVRDLAAARLLARIDPVEAGLLEDAARPIVLLRARPHSALAHQVAPGTDLLGLMLPSTPLHHLLLAGGKHPMVMTSGNRRGAPILICPEAARRELSGVADLFLVHDRPIANRADDSVVAVLSGRSTLLRRARGYVPRPVHLPRAVARPTLAVGALLKAAPCLAVDDTAWLGPHVGDLEGVAAMEAMEESVARLEQLLGVRAEVLAHDLHPDLPSTRWASARPALARVGVQHHHAHVAAALAEHGLMGPALALTWDGVGLGTDGTGWGGELLLADLAGFTRIATLSPLPLAGGDQAVREPWRLALALLMELGHKVPDCLPFSAIPGPRIESVRRMLRQQVACPPVHGLGRWFDAVGALLLGRAVVDFEGQLAMELETAARRWTGRERIIPLPFSLDRSGEPWVLNLWPAVGTLINAWLAGQPGDLLAARFHQTLVEAGFRLIARARQVHGPLPALLTGGCFQNALLVDGLVHALPTDLPLLRHGECPPGDGGLSLGQVLVADAVLRATRAG